MKLTLSIIETEPVRPAYASGPRSLASVRLLRISITDRCNFRCIYCMPANGLRFMPTQDVMRASDIQAVAAAARSIGVDHFKITGGEPLVRNDAIEIIHQLHQLAPQDISLTTNGILLSKYAKDLKQAGLNRVTISLDTLNPQRFDQIAGSNGHFKLQDVLDGIDAAEDAGFERIKLNVVVMAGINDDEVADLARLTLNKPWTVRFIEYMPLGQSQLLPKHHKDSAQYILPSEQVIAKIQQQLGELRPLDRKQETGVGPANVYQIPNAKGRLGFISAMSRPFCESCNRLRLTASGDLRACLFDGGEINILNHLNKPDTTDRIIHAMSQCVGLKPDLHAKIGNRAMSQLGG